MRKCLLCKDFAGGEGGSHANIWRKSIPGRGKGKARLKGRNVSAMFVPGMSGRVEKKEGKTSEAGEE